MKRRDLMRHLRRHGCRNERQGGDHEIWINPVNGKIQPIPRHAEISWRLARSICQKLDIEITTKK